MKAIPLALVLTLLPTLTCAQSSTAASGSRESIDVYIRRLADLPASSATGEIQITDVGHQPMDTMLSMVARRGAFGWHVSYACAASPHCAKEADHLALSYDIGDAATLRVDAILAQLKAGKEPDGAKPGPGEMCGNLTVVIDYRGFRQTYARSCSWGRLLGELDDLLRPHGSDR